MSYGLKRGFPVASFTLWLKSSAAAKWSANPSMLFLNRLHRLFFRLGRAVDIQTLHAIAQGVAANLQLFGRATDAETVLRERVLNELPFELGHGVVERLGHGCVCRLGFLQAALDRKIRQV